MMENIPAPKKIEDTTYAFYNTNGKKYVNRQREFYSKSKDTGRDYLRKSLSANIKNMTVVDIGCGAGDDLIAYSEMGAADVIGIEPAMTMLEEAKKSIAKDRSNIKLVAGEWNHLPLTDASVDAVTARYSLHLLPDFKTAFPEVARVLKKDGLFLIATLYPQHDAGIAKEKIKTLIFNGELTVENPPHIMDDYVGEECLKYFVVEEKLPYSMNEDRKEAQPTGLLLKLRRK
jgi:ubiquinone/menaquinone biosynthesis C-methylase UbiE